MSMQDLTEGFAIIDANPEQGFFAGRRDLALIAAAESALGGTFPPTYRAFLERFGAGNFGAFEVYGVIGPDFEKGPVPDGVWLTLKQRRAGTLPQNLLIVGDTGDGGYYCLELEKGQETPVIIYWPGFPARQQQHAETVAEDFGEFFLGQIRQQL